MDKMIVSKYVLIFEKNNTYLLFNSKNRSFLELTKELYEELLAFRDGRSSLILEEAELVEQLTDLGVLTTKEEDQAFLDEIILRHNILYYSKDLMSITLAPTIACNLRCPYCFEKSKPKGIISKETCDKVVEFIKRNQTTASLDLTWFGGEPLLAIDRIAYFLEKLRENNITLSSHSIVTNATLLKGKALEVFEKYPLNSIQITLDGIKEHHDKLRVYSSGKGSYDEIIANLDEFIKRNPKTLISIRVNTGTHNANDFAEIKSLIHNRYPTAKNIMVYPGILKGDNDCGDMSNFFSSKDLSVFHTSLQNETEKVTIPESTCKGCIANMLNGYVIGPRGEIYKCWEDIGIKEREIGSVIDDRCNNAKLFQQYMLHGSFINDKQCHQCSLLSICSGGCARSRLANVFEGKHQIICDHYNLEHCHSLKNILYLYYLEYCKQD